MKKILIMFSSIIFLVIANNGIVKTNENAMLTKQPTTNKESENSSVLFNNKYGYLSNSDWITNQSAINGNFYSYDTSHLTNADGSPWYLSDGTDARNAFKVDSNGQLVDNIKISDQDKADLENSKAEMVNYRKITKFKYDYDPYCSSGYSDQYFNDKNNQNNNWQYLQFSSSGKRIDISNQKDANKVEYSNNLSEAWGLYYIAKAVKENQITQTVADSLANAFISQSSLQGKISNSKVVDEIINLIITNNDIYDLLLRIAPIKVTAKNYSLNFIFDSNNNLIKVNYQKLSFALNFSYEESFNGTASHNLSNRNIHYLFNTTDYFNDWNDFCNNCGTIGFTSDSLVAANGKYSKEEIKGSKLSINTKMIPENNGVLEQKWMVTAFYDGGAFGAHYDLTLEIYFIHLNNELAFYWDLYEDSSMCNQGISFTINIKPIFNF